MANLTRYELTIQHGKDGEHVALYHAMENGEWVKFEDVKELLQTAHNKQSTPLVEFCEDCGRQLDMICSHCNDDSF